MDTTHHYPPMDGSPLCRALSRLLPPSTNPTSVNPAQRLAELVSFTDSIKLSQRYAGLRAIKRDTAQQEGEAAGDAFLRVRASLITSVMRSFDPDSRASRFKLPAFSPAESGEAESGSASREDSEKAAEAYQKFYVTHQRQMDLTVQELRNRVRNSASATSTELARLAALDALLADLTTSHSRSCYGVIPGLLREHYERLQRDFTAADSQIAPNQQDFPPYVKQFCDDMRAALLAEIDDRLLPVLGLVEAINLAFMSTAPNTPARMR